VKLWNFENALQIFRNNQNMKTQHASIILLSSFFLCGCVITSHRSEMIEPVIHFTPPLDAQTMLLIAAQDERPTVETEREPSTEYLYTSYFFPVDGNAENVSKQIGDSIVRFGGAQFYFAKNSLPTNAVGINFKLEHWYARTLRDPKQPPIIVKGEFAGMLELQRDGHIIFSRHIQEEGIPTVVDTYIVFESEKKQTPQLIEKAMEDTANTAFSKGLAQIMIALQDNWQQLQTNTVPIRTP
jgi:hypothetical protein